MDNRKPRAINRKFKKRTKSFTEALKEKYCVDDEPTFDFIIVSPKRKSNATEAELAHLRTVVLNEMDVNRAELPVAGLTSLCPNVVDLDLANNLLESWPELLAILADLPAVKYVNVSGNKLSLGKKDEIPSARLSVENLALNFTGSTIPDVVRLSQLMPALKELHLCGNDYRDLADIEKDIDDGAFSALECLRLNNNGITRWSEVWKLRHLPQLKYLILSGNPVKDIFYNIDGESNMPGLPKEDHHVGVNHDTDPMDWTTSSGADGEKEGEEEVEEVLAEGDAGDGVDDDNDDDFLVEGEGCDDAFGDDGTDVREDDDQSLDHDRPVSRFGYHKDDSALLSDDVSDDEQDTSGGEESSSSQAPVAMPITNAASENINIPLPEATSKGKKVHNTNYNNSRNVRAARRSPFDDSTSGSSNNLTPLDVPVASFPDLMQLSVPGGPDFDVEDEEDNPGDWPRLAAEQFLYDLIDQLDLGESSAAAAASSSNNIHTSTAPLSPGSSSLFSTTSADSSAQPIWLSDMSSAQLTSVPQTESQTSGMDRAPQETVSGTAPRHGADTNQNAATGEDAHSAFMSRMLAAINDDEDEPSGPEAENNVFAAAFHEDDFVPRSVSMLDEETNLSPPGHPFYLGKSHKSSPARRRLFSSSPPVVSNSSPPTSHNPCQAPERMGLSESDSCSDCESEQHSVTAALRHELANSAPMVACPVDGPGSWLEANRSFDTSVRDAEGNHISVSTTYVPGARVVVNGLSNDPEANFTSCSCDGETKDSGMYRAGNQQAQEGPQHTNQSEQQQPSPKAELATGSPASTRPVPFQHLQMLCLSSAAVSHSDHLHACVSFPKLNNVRLKNNPLYATVNNDDRRKLYIASLPKVTILNGSEVSVTEREKAERFFLRYFMDQPEKPELYHKLVAKHGPPVKLVDIDLRAGYQEWATLTFKCEGAAHFTRRLHLVEPVSRLRTLVSQVLALPKWCFVMHHHPCGPSHPECEREMVELRCEALPMSRFDFAEGDEIIIQVSG